MVVTFRVSYIGLVLCLFFYIAVSSQNLIKNPSFEQFGNCPKHLGNFNADVVFWSTPTEGSTDYFNACSTAMGTPDNFNGTQPANFGKGYAGLYLYAPDDYREYLQAELRQPLEKGKTYLVSFFVSLAERSDFAVKEFGILFAKDKLELSGKKELSKNRLYQQKGNSYNYMEIGYTNFYSDTQDWISVNTQFTAKGTERYMLLGNFNNNARTRLFKTKRNAKQGAYYYVDMVSVLPAEPEDISSRTEDVLTDKEVLNFELDKPHVFRNVLFDFDKSQLLETARSELRHIQSYLFANTDMQIKIDGHTDSVGSVAYNEALSMERARAVANYLLEIGLEKGRVSWQGHGGQKPIATNRTEAGRKQNRRVEFVITRLAGDE